MTQEMDTAFRCACGQIIKGGPKPSLARARELLAEGAVNVDSQDSDGWTALHHATGQPSTTFIEFLIDEAGATVDIPDCTGCTPLWVACFNNQRDIVKVLLRAGADTTIAGRPEGEPTQTPALAARRQRHPGLADLIDAEATLRAADPTRHPRQVAREMTLEEYRESVRLALKPTDSGM